MKEEFVNYNQALALKELGYNEDCLGRWLAITEWEEPTGEIKLQLGVKVEDYDKNQCLAPLKQQVFRWFRERHDLLSWVFTPFGVSNGYFHEIVNLSNIVLEGGFSSGQSAQYTTYEEAELSCIDELIEIVKNK